MYIDHIEDDPTDPNMAICYVGYGTDNQIAYRMERAMILEIDLPTPFADISEP